MKRLVYIFLYFCSNKIIQVMKKKIIYGFLSVVLLLLLLTIGGSFYMINYALVRDTDKEQTVKERFADLREKYPETNHWIDSLHQNKALRDTFIMAQDGDRHHAVFAFAHTPTNKVAFLVHGYKDSYVKMLRYAKIYADHGFNIIIPDLHACGQSDGEALQMGWKDRLDVLQWMDIANKIFADSTGSTQMVLHGLSMGATTTMCVSGEKTPDYLKCFVEDCGYTDAWSEFSNELKSQFGLPEFPILYTASFICKMKYGWDFKEASALEQVKKCRRPMMFIHGDKDTFVAFDMLEPLVEAKVGRKEVFIAPGSKHAASYHDHKKEYIRRVMLFVNRYIH